jgi:hypothetical protein
MPFVVSADEETNWGKVVEVWSGYQNGQVLFKLDIPHENPKSCGAATFYAVNPEIADPAKFLSILLYAKASQQIVKVMLSETECQYNYPSALRIGVK